MRAHRSTPLVRRAVLGLTVAGVLAACGAADAPTVQQAEPGPPSATSDPTASVPGAGAPAPGAQSAPGSPGITAIDGPSTVSTPAERDDTPLRVHWLGGSDVAWNEVSLPLEMYERLSNVAGRPLDVRTRTRQAAMPVDAAAMIREAVDDRTDAVVVSMNLVWLHWDEAACDGIDVPHDRYRCLLTPVSTAVSQQRWRELEAMVDAAVASGVPAYFYVQPHSTDVLSNPAVEPLIAEAERRFAALDPGDPQVRFVSRVFSRDLPPLREGEAFHDMVHPTAAGADVLGSYLADQLRAFWTTVRLGA